MKRRVLLAGVALLVVALAAVFLRGDGVVVDVAEAHLDTLSVTIPAEGRTRPRERFTIAAPITGRVTRIAVEEGDAVAQGQLLTRLYPAPEDPRIVATARAEVGVAEARLLEATARVREAEVQAVQAQREVERRRPLAEMGAIAPERMEQAELAAVVATEREESAEAALQSARATLDAARARLLGEEPADGDVGAVAVVSPIRGRVLAVPDESERVVAAGSPLLVLAEMGGLEVVLDILSEDAVNVQPGSDLLITGWGGDGVLRGTVRTVTGVGYTKISALGVEEQRVDVIADLTDVPSTLGTGYRVSGDIVTWRASDVLVIPTSALFRAGEEWHVFAVESGRAVRRTVRAGHRNESSVEIVDGLAANDTVIVFPSEEVEDGVAVRIR